MSDIRIPPALDRHLVSAAHAAATTGEPGTGGFDAVAEQIVRALRDQGATSRQIERAFRDVFAGLSYAYQRTPAGERYDALEVRAVAMIERAVTDRSAIDRASYADRPADRR